MAQIPVTVVSLPTFLRASRELGLSEEEVAEFERIVAYDPGAGELIEGTGGIRKRRVALPRRNKGKSGGGRLFTIYFNAANPVYILTIIDKSREQDLAQPERKELAELAATLKSQMRRTR